MQFVIYKFLIFSYLIPNSIFCTSVVGDKNNKILNVLKSMGLQSLPYWLANFTFDYLMYLINALVFIVLLLNLSGGLDSSQAIAISLLFTFYGSANILFAYCWSFLIKRSSRAFIYYLAISIAYYSIGFRIFN